MQCMQLLRSQDTLHAPSHGDWELRQMWLLCAIEDVDSPVMALPLHTLQQLDLAAGGRHSAASPLLAGAD